MAIPAVLVAFALVEEVDGGELTLGVLFSTGIRLHTLFSVPVDLHCHPDSILHSLLHPSPSTRF